MFVSRNHNITRKQKLIGSVVVVASAVGSLGAGAAEVAQGGGSVDFAANIAVSTANTCGITVTGPADTDFKAKWVVDSTSASEPATITTEGSTDARKISWEATGGTSCGVPELFVDTRVDGGVTAPFLKSTTLVRVNAAGAFWGVSPLIDWATAAGGVGTD